jgi:hypothetical protein
MESQGRLSRRIAGLPLKECLHPFNILSAVESVLLFIFVEISGRPGGRVKYFWPRPDG